jgi:hypothetical protein
MLSNDSVGNVGNVIDFCPAGNSVNPLITSGCPFDPLHRRWAAIGGAHAARGGCASLQRAGWNLCLCELDASLRWQEGFG